VVSSCEHGKELSGSIKCGKFLSRWQTGGFSRRKQLQRISEFVTWVSIPGHNRDRLLLYTERSTHVHWPRFCHPIQRVAKSASGVPRLWNKLYLAGRAEVRNVDKIVTTDAGYTSIFINTLPAMLSLMICRFTSSECWFSKQKDDAVEWAGAIVNFVILHYRKPLHSAKSIWSLWSTAVAFWQRKEETSSSTSPGNRVRHVLCRQPCAWNAPCLQQGIPCDAYEKHYHLMPTYLLTYLLKELSPSWEAANCAAPRELASILWDPKVHHCVQKSPPLVPILHQIDSVHTSDPISLRCNLILSTHLRLALLSGLPTNILHAFLFSPIRATC
jgi:hypothetical protein